MRAWLEALALVFSANAIALFLAVGLVPFFRKVFAPAYSWALCRVLAPALVSYAMLVPAAVVGKAWFTRWTALAAWLLLSALAWGAHRYWRLGFADREEKKAGLAFEVYFTGFLLVASFFITFIPSVAALGERVRDTALWVAILTHGVFPFEEPWLSGVSIRYYVFAYFPHALLALFTGAPPLKTYNLALAWVAVNYAVALYTAFRAIGLSAKWASLGGVLVFLGSNGKCFLQAWEWFWRGQPYNWWDPSRAIKNTITEFPLWTATLGDLHPHYLTLPIFAALAAVCLGALRPAPLRVDTRYFVGLAALIIGWLWGGNTWEVPIAIGLCACVLLALLRENGIKKTAVYGIVMVLAARVVAEPFIRFSAKTPRAFGWVSNRSDVGELWLVHGLFWLPLFVFLFFKTLRSLKREWQWGMLCFLFVSIAVNSPLLFLGLITTGVFVAWNREQGPLARQALLFSLFALGVVVFCELWHLKDVYGDALQRYNTVFKFYMPAWTLFGISAVALAFESRALLPRRVWAPAGVLWIVALSSHLSVGLAARFAAGQAPLEGLAELERLAPEDADLIRWMQSEVQANRLSGVLLEAVGGSYSFHQRFASTTGLRGYAGWEGYGYWPIYGLSEVAGQRITTARALWSGSRFPASGTDCAALKSALREEGIELVAIGSLERKAYPAPVLDRMRSCLKTLYSARSAVLLSVSD